MSPILERLIDLLDLVLHWRFNLFFLAGILLALWILGQVPDQGVAWVLATAAVLAGAVAGLWWQSKS